jgi:hypothetical protein
MKLDTSYLRISLGNTKFLSAESANHNYSHQFTWHVHTVEMIFVQFCLCHFS